tara:strand:+ start:695 stop:1219 length:525 start_codon:yes stop_codon:yes gene_type:complete
MLDAIIGIASSSGLGAIVGLVGSYMAKREQRKLDEMNNVHDVRMAKIDMERDAAESAQALQMADKQIEQSQAEAEIASEVSAGEAFTASQLMANQASGVTWVDGLRSLMRPLITIYLLVIVTYITANLHTSLGGLDALAQADLFKLYTHIINQTVFLTVTAVLWWFGSRTPASK